MLTDGVITLRHPRDDDADAIYAVCQDSEIQKWTGVPTPYRREDALAWLERTARERAQGRAHAFVGEAAGGEIVGTFSVMELDRAPGYGEIGYFVAAPARGRGVATRAVTLLRDWCVSELGLDRVELLIHEDNAPSLRVAELTGFVDTGELRNAPRAEDPGPPRYRVLSWSPA